jgi:hypothetical protein
MEKKIAAEVKKFKFPFPIRRPLTHSLEWLEVSCEMNGSIPECQPPRWLREFVTVQSQIQPPVRHACGVRGVLTPTQTGVQPALPRSLHGKDNGCCRDHELEKGPIVVLSLFGDKYSGRLGSACDAFS